MCNKFVKLLICVIIMLSSCCLVSCKGYKTKSVLVELEAAFNDYEQGDEVGVEQVFQKYQNNNIIENKKIKRYISERIDKMDFCSTVEILCLLNELRYSLIGFDVDRMIIESFKEGAEDFKLDDSSVQMLISLKDINVGKLTYNQLGEEIKKAVSFKDRVKYMKKVPLEIVEDEELFDYVLKDCQTPVTSLNSNGYYKKSDEYYKEWGESQISGIYTESGSSYGDFFIKRRTKSYLDYYYQFAFDEDEYLYFKGKEIKYGSKIILLLRDQNKYSSTHKLYYDEYHIYLYSANKYSPDIRDVEVYVY